MKERIIKILIVSFSQPLKSSLKAVIEKVYPKAILFTAEEDHMALQCAIAENPDIVLLDILMSGTDVFKLCQAFKEDKRLNAIPIVFLVNEHVNKESRRLAVEVGADAFLTDPPDEDDLVLLVRAMVRIKVANNEKQNKKEQLQALVEQQAQELQLTHPTAHSLAVSNSEAYKDKNQNEVISEEKKIIYKLHTIFPPEGNISDLELEDVIDIASIQNLMENFWELTHIPMAIIDVKGKVLVGVGWQDICTKFHRVHPESCANCMESDVYLTKGIPEGEFRLYKCQNNMWDIATPLIIGQVHMGNLFMGQFFFDSEPNDESLFRKQASLYNFDEKAYLDALERAPRISKQRLDHAKAFFLNLSRSISQLSFSNILLARAISRQNKIEDALRENEELLNKAQEIARLGSWSLDLTTNHLIWSDEMYRIFGLNPQQFTATYEGFLEMIHPNDREAVNTCYINSLQEGKDGFMVEHRIICRNTGQIRHVVEKCQHFKDEHGDIVRSVGMTHDITERKTKEEVLYKLNNTLAALSKSSQAMTQSVNENDYLNQVCKIVAEYTGFAMIWIGYAQYDHAKTVIPVVSAGFSDNYLQTIKITWDESDSGRGPTGTAIRTGKMAICNNMFTDPTFNLWREQAIKRGYACSVAFPLKSGEKTFGAMTIYAKEPDSFLEDEINLLSELANDLAHGITTIRLREAHRLAENALSKSHNELELLVKDRTRELQITNELLQKEINIGKQQELNLKLAEEKYRTVADHTIGWEFWIDKEENFLYCSPSCERITGYKASDFLNNPHLLYDIIHPDDLRSFHSHRKNKELNQVKDSELEYRIIRPDGSVRWIGHICQPITDEMGFNKGVRGSNRDITRRKEMEQLLKTSNQKYRLLSANITDGIFICNQGRLEYVNKAMKRIFGFNKYKMEGLMLNHLALPEYQKELNEILNIQASTNQLRNIEIECYKKNHSVIYVEMLFTYVAREKVIYGVVHDITDRKQIQKNTVKAIILTEEKERAYFSKELHDGLGPLLSAIKLYLQWSERPKSDETRIEIIHKAEDILEEALATVKEISNKLSPHLLNYYGLTAAIQSFVDKVADTTDLKISFESNVSIRLGNEIEAAFYRATIECINNSLKYAKAKNINIMLDYTDDVLQLQYTDDGIGFNLEETLAIKKGLGLYNLQNRIQTIGGKITMFSSPGKGVNYQIVVKL
ncbi:MAG: PocR ligand-binding domain-containing protein [Candidatus Saccharibacteria bacterium]